MEFIVISIDIVYCILHCILLYSQSLLYFFLHCILIYISLHAEGDL